MPDRQPAGPSRRAVLGGAAGLVVAAVTGLTACGSEVAGGVRSAGSDTEPEPVPGDDDVLVAALAETERLADLVRATLRRHPGLRGDLGPLRDLHAVHDAELRPSDGGPSSGSPAPDPVDVPPRPPRARAAVLAAEREAVTTYAELAVASESGRLARLLASVAAALAQRLAVLDPGADPALPRPGLLVADGDLPAEAAEATQVALAGEHAAVWTLAVVGARTSSSANPTLYEEVDDAYGVHRDRRDTLTDALRAAGEDPVAAEPAYVMPDVAAGGDEDGARDSARGVEDRCAATYAYLVAGTTGDVRGWALRAVTDAALARLRLGGDPQDLPGL